MTQHVTSLVDSMRAPSGVAVFRDTTQQVSRQWVRTEVGMKVQPAKTAKNEEPDRRKPTHPRSRRSAVLATLGTRGWRLLTLHAVHSQPLQCSSLADLRSTCDHAAFALRACRLSNLDDYTRCRLLILGTVHSQPWQCFSLATLHGVQVV